MMEYLQAQNKFVFSGQLVFKNAVELLKNWEALKEQSLSQLTLDCSAIVKADSSFLALLIEMRHWAYKNNIPFVLVGLPIFLKNFLTVYGIEEVLTNGLTSIDSPSNKTIFSQAPTKNS